MFRNDFKPMMNNYNSCVKRYNGLQRQLTKGPMLEMACTAEIHKQIDKDNLEKVEEDPLFASDPNRYVNHRPQICVAR